jgi:hypothetical protein
LSVDAARDDAEATTWRRELADLVVLLGIVTEAESARVLFTPTGVPAALAGTPVGRPG